jgi:YD repeat-containing protein
LLDEVRYYPKGATMITYTYDPGIGKTSECDPNNRITRYEYDGLGRLVKVKDQYNNLIKTFEYNYQQ